MQCNLFENILHTSEFKRGQESSLEPRLSVPDFVSQAE